MTINQLEKFYKKELDSLTRAVKNDIGGSITSEHITNSIQFALGAAHFAVEMGSDFEQVEALFDKHSSALEDLREIVLSR